MEAELVNKCNKYIDSKRKSPYPCISVCNESGSECESRYVEKDRGWPGRGDMLTCSSWAALVSPQ